MCPHSVCACVRESACLLVCLPMQTSVTLTHTPASSVSLVTRQESVDIDCSQSIRTRERGGGPWTRCTLQVACRTPHGLALASQPFLTTIGRDPRPEQRASMQGYSCTLAQHATGDFDQKLNSLPRNRRPSDTVSVHAVSRSLPQEEMEELM